MTLHPLWRRRAVAFGVGIAAAAPIAGALPHVAYADVTPTITISSPSSGKLAAGTAKQVMILNVSGLPLSETLVTGVVLGGDTTCNGQNGMSSYIVTSSTTIAVKTPDGGCTATDPTATNGEDITIKLAGGSSITRTADATHKGVYFVAPPSIATTDAVYTENSSELTTKIKQFVSNGGQYVRVSSGSSYAFNPQSAAGLAVTFGGKAGTDVKVYDASTKAQILASVGTAPSTPNYLVFKSAAGMSTDGTLSITQGGVTKSFTATDTGASIINSPTVTSLSVSSGKVNSGVSTVITGTGFDNNKDHYAASGGTWSVNFCGMAGTVTAVDTGGTKITVTAPDVGGSATGLGGTTFEGSCAVTVTNNSGQSPITSPVSPGSYFQFLSQ